MDDLIKLRKQRDALDRKINKIETEKFEKENSEYVGKYYKEVESSEGIEDFQDDYVHVSSVDIDTFYGEIIVFGENDTMFRRNEMIFPKQMYECTKEEFETAKGLVVKRLFNL